MNCTIVQNFTFYIRQTGTVFVCGAWSKIVVRSWTYTVIEATTPKQIVLFDKYLQQQVDLMDLAQAFV